MRILVVGSGGREHALAWALKRSPSAGDVFVAPGNGGTAEIAENVAIPAEDIDSLARFVAEKRIDLTVVGPETPLVEGIVDRLNAEGKRCFGPTRAAARLEGSKVFSKEFMRRHGIPTADFEVFGDASAARGYVRSKGAPIVVKADGLAAGKGAIVAKTLDEAERAIDEIMERRAFGAAGDRVVVEECLEGEEVSIHAVCGGGKATLLPSSQDHKRVFDGDLGPNTGGMGAYAPVRRVGDDVRRMVLDRVILPTLRGMESEGHPFSGVLYAGLMMTAEGPRVLEYNVRFGDPETQVLLPLVKSDFAALLHESAGGALPDTVELHEDRFAATVVVASRGYPGSYDKGIPIAPLDAIGDESRVVFHAGTKRTGSGLVTAGGRVLAVTAWAGDLAAALRHAYEGAAMVRFEGAFWRTDIGKRSL
ncbi:MAG: Phosphoribosylamine--glycine ligase [Candidatus Krumholzibacteriota bacterium]|nr:Phosphoribosylamine--glycine ligase [Candidatus Krumholzibacteriota bacterium]